MIAALALMLAATAPAATPAHMSQAEQLSMIDKALSTHGMSPAGIAKVKANLQVNSVRMPALMQRVQQTTVAVHAAATASPFNPVAFETAMHARRTAILALAAFQEDAKVGLYDSLSAPDKKAFAVTFAGGENR